MNVGLFDFDDVQRKAVDVEGVVVQWFGPMAYRHSVDASARLTASTRIRAGQDPEVIAAQLWSAVHGFITLELADNFSHYADPLTEILLALTVNVMTGLGDRRTAAHTSGTAGITRYLSIDAETHRR